MVKRYNILVVPADHEAAGEVIAALRHEKAAHLVLAPETRALDAVPGATVLAPVGEPSAVAAQQLLAGTELVFAATDSWAGALRPLAEAGAIPLVDMGGSDSAGHSHLCCSTRTGALLYCASLDAGTGIHAPASDDVRAAALQAARAQGITGGWSFTPDAGEGAPVSRTPSNLWAQHRMLGANLPLLSLFDALGKAVSVLVADGARVGEGGALSLPVGTVFLDLDDTLLVHGALHDGAQGFLDRAAARDIPVHLVTRHYRDPAITLAEHGIDSAVFAQVHWLRDGTPKSRVMTGYPHAIFIDDSFQERREVAAALAIPTFAPDVIAHLLT